MNPRHLLTLCLTCLCSLSALTNYTRADQTAPDDQLPIRKVVLYKHGVGYFERAGQITDNADISLHFKREQMNDLLKSLTIHDLGGGRVGSVVYDSTKTIEQLLEAYNFNLRRNNLGLPQIMGQLAGSEIELAVGSNIFTGTLIGVEERLTETNDTQTRHYYLSIIDRQGKIDLFGSVKGRRDEPDTLWPGCLRTFRMDHIAAVRFLDQQLESDLQRYMEILFAQHRRDQKTLNITSLGAGRRELRVAYVIEAPVWKATYRIVLPDNDNDKPFLQGWAIVDNVSAHDWNNVQLTLVSGLPISFIQNLYDPRFQKRPVVALQDTQAAAPTVPQIGYAARATGMAKKPNAFAPAMDAPVEMEANERFLGRSDTDGDMAQSLRELQAATVTRELGDLFEYRIDHPVTVARNRSALLPFVAEEIDGSAVALYNEQTRAKNPLSAVRLQNTTGKTLEGGPLTVLQGASYVGEALTNTIKSDEQRYLTYAVDLGLHVNTKHDSKRQDVERVIINRGNMRIQRALIETKSYNLDNKDDRAKTVVIEHPLRQDYELLQPKKPLEKTDNFLRFEVDVPASQLVKFEVREQRDIWDRVVIRNITPEDIAVYFKQKYISNEIHQQLQTIVALKAEIVELQRLTESLTRERDEIRNTQEHLTKTLRSLRDSAEEKQLRRRYITQLDQYLDRLTAIENSLKQADTQQRTKRKQLDRLIEQLSQDLTLK